MTGNGSFVPTAGLSAGSGSGAGPPAGLPRWGPAAGTGTGFAAPTGHAGAFGGGRTPECTRKVVPPPKGWRTGDDHTLCVHCRRALERQGGSGYGGYGGYGGGWGR